MLPVHRWPPHWQGFIQLMTMSYCSPLLQHIKERGELCNLNCSEAGVELVALQSKTWRIKPPEKHVVARFCANHKDELAFIQLQVKRGQR